jgi:hypothetical protein
MLTMCLVYFLHSRERYKSSLSLRNYIRLEGLFLSIKRIYMAYHFLEATQLSSYLFGKTIEYSYFFAATTLMTSP